MSRPEVRLRETGIIKMRFFLMNTLSLFGRYMYEAGRCGI